MRGAVLRRAAGAHDVERRREGVGLGAGRRHDGGRVHALGGPAGAGVDQVAEPPAVGYEKLRAGAAGAQGFVAQR